MSKRKVNNYQNNVYQINPSNLFLEENTIIDLDLFLSNFDLYFLNKYIYSNDVNLMKYGVYILRKYIATNNPENLNSSVMNDNVLINYLCSLLDYPDNTVRFESSWILINMTNYSDNVINFISTGKNRNYILDFFYNSDEYLIEHALWLIGNLCADNADNRQFLINSGIIDRMATLLADFATPDLIKEKIVWTVCNLSRCKILDNAHQFLELTTPLKKFFCNSVIESEINECLYIIYKLTSASALMLARFISVDLYKKLVFLINNYSVYTKYYCVRIIANLASGNDVQTQTLINEGVVDLYRNLIEDDDPKIIKEALWGISNICGGTVSQIERVYECGLLNRIIELADYLLLKVIGDKTLYETLRECAYCITNSLSGGLNQFRSELMQTNKTKDLIVMLIHFLHIFYKERRIVHLTLLTIKCYLFMEDDEEIFLSFSIRQKLLNNGFEDILLEMITYPNESVNAVSLQIDGLLKEMGKDDMNTYT